MRKAQEENSRRIVARALDICKERQVGATGAVVEGDAKEAIRQAAPGAPLLAKPFRAEALDDAVRAALRPAS